VEEVHVSLRILVQVAHLVTVDQIVNHLFVMESSLMTQQFVVVMELVCCQMCVRTVLEDFQEVIAKFQYVSELLVMHPMFVRVWELVLLQTIAHVLLVISEINVNFLSVLDSILPIRWFVLLMGTVLQRILVHAVDHTLVHNVIFKDVLDSNRMTHVCALVKEIVHPQMFVHASRLIQVGTVNFLIAMAWQQMSQLFAQMVTVFVLFPTFVTVHHLGMERHVKLQYVLERMQQTLPFARREVLVLHRMFVPLAQETMEAAIVNFRFVMDY
jgi:hypothetical protein